MNEYDSKKVLEKNETAAISAEDDTNNVTLFQHDDELTPEYIDLQKKQLIASSKTLGLSKVKINYDGFGDSGWIDSIESFNNHGAAPLDPHLKKVAESFAWAVLDRDYTCFGDCAGSWGYFEINVGASTIQHIHCERSEDYSDMEI